MELGNYVHQNFTVQVDKVDTHEQDAEPPHPQREGPASVRRAGLSGSDQPSGTTGWDHLAFGSERMRV